MKNPIRKFCIALSENKGGSNKRLGVGLIVLLILCLSFSSNTLTHSFQALEDYLWQSSDLLDRLEDMREDLNHNDFADDVAGAKKGLDLHSEVKKKIHKIPVENIDSMGQRLLQR